MCVETGPAWGGFCYLSRSGKPDGGVRFTYAGLDGEQQRRISLTLTREGRGGGNTTPNLRCSAGGGGLLKGGLRSRSRGRGEVTPPGPKRAKEDTSNAAFLRVAAGSGIPEPGTTTRFSATQACTTVILLVVSVPASKGVEFETFAQLRKKKIQLKSRED